MELYHPTKCMINYVTVPKRVSMKKFLLQKMAEAAVTPLLCFNLQWKSHCLII